MMPLRHDATLTADCLPAPTPLLLTMLLLRHGCQLPLVVTLLMFADAAAMLHATPPCHAALFSPCRRRC